MSDYYLLTKVEDIQDDKLKLGKTKRNINIYHGKQRLFFRSGKLRMPFGVQINKFKTYSDFTEYYIDFSLIESENEEFISLLKEMETRIKTLLADQKLLSEDTLDEITPKFTSILKENDGYPPLFKVNIPRKSSGHFDFTVFDQEKEIISISDSNIQDVLSKGSFCKIVFEIDKIWYFKERYGITLKLNQLRLCKKDEREIESKDGNNISEGSGSTLDKQDSDEDLLVTKLKKISYSDSMFLDD